MRKIQVAFSMTTAYRKCGIQARVFSQTLAHRNRKNEIIQREEGKKTGVSIERCKAGTKKHVSTAYRLSGIATPRSSGCIA